MIRGVTESTVEDAALAWTEPSLCTTSPIGLTTLLPILKRTEMQVSRKYHRATKRL